ncbi:MAG: Mth938-like domain-containing protein [Rhodospirillales bacterium]|nr:Mth938-like domain-containing protein [Rhodospirillales bacterium]
MVEVTSSVPSGRQVVEAYGGGGFRVSGTAYRGSVLVTPDASFCWPVSGFDALAPESFQPFLSELAEIEILLLGCGAKLLPVSKTLRAAGPVLEPMDTGAACRTYNVLLAEERRVAAALIAVE